MLERVDRVQLAVRDRAAAAQTFRDILGAQVVREDRLRLYAASRTVVQAGESEFELLEPAGEGALAQHLDRWGEGIFAAGFSTPDPASLSGRLEGAGLQFVEEAGQLFIDPGQTRGMRTVISQSRDRQPAGLISRLYEVTNIVADHQEAAAFYARAFGLDSSRFHKLNSERWGYVGTLTLFGPPQRLDRIELTQITEPSLAMGRYFARRGPSIYMCYAEAPDVGAIQRRLEERGARYTPQPEEPEGGLFIHPSALHGMLMGISRTDLAWLWSGAPERSRSSRA
ncbi:MAG: VOC family protein [Dehalococcoidia bacterium]|nr:VOC family protein [Dehalococcoidia bacterium]